MENFTKIKILVIERKMFMKITVVFICVYFAISTILVILRYINDRKEQIERLKQYGNIQHKNRI